MMFFFKGRNFILLSFLIGLSFAFLNAQEAISYKEIPYYLKQLEQTNLEEKRYEFLKLIHDSIVQADLLDKQTVKEMTPIIESVLKAMDSGLDRAYLDGKSYYLASAVDYFEDRKLKPEVDLAESDWLELQSKRGSMKLSTYPDRILIHTESTTTLVAMNTHIHEAVISPEQKRVAYFRTTDQTALSSEIWVVDIRRKKQKRIISVPSCYTILFSNDGDDIFYQEKPVSMGKESRIFRVSSKGGKPRFITSGTLLQTLAKNGPYQGYLIVYKKIIHHWGATDQECPVVVKPSGQIVGRIRNAPCK